MSPYEIFSNSANFMQVVNYSCIAAVVVGCFYVLAFVVGQSVED